MGGFFALNQKATGDGLGMKGPTTDYDVYRTAAPADATTFPSTVAAVDACFQPRKPDLEVAGAATVTVSADSAADAYFLDPGAACYDNYLHCQKMSSPTDTTTQKSQCDLTMQP